MISYIRCNLAVISFLLQQPWISPSPLVVAGHSEGSTIAAKMASRSARISPLIYSGGNPQGRMLTLITRERAHETDSTRGAGVPYLDLFRTEMIRLHKKNFYYREYIGTEHNYFPLKPNGEPDYDRFNRDRVAEDWRQWLLTQPPLPH
ncbi:hypothetical protein SAMN04488128_102419 [Chitinophaga eiseniae]|uniref:Alpha/beta hydrolase family protein n=1 Tax=Chitinophaga eiseniae TaxID=634771 RepID=A0A1T4QK81_9BACT|nr:hypothetical protein [Chitinophaga eiseniae]SKA04104.1 hypothetical protein SAMN04488128_102419 [Chitinophaga eiseniae]